jgi:hypothetical protein
MGEVQTIGRAVPLRGWLEPTESLEVDRIDQLRHRTLRGLYAYWDERRGARAFPARCELDPVDIPRLLPHIVLLDVRGRPSDLVFRLAGTEVVSRLGFGVTGRRLLDLPVAGVDRLQRELAEVAISGRPQFVTAGYRSQAEEYKSIDQLVLPLGRDGAKVDMLIGAVVFNSYSLSERTFLNTRAFAYYGLVRRR